ncbi:MAG: GNAT family N-acetyltransferase [Silicimonas sp.]|nr:GNAT family N-acetyltransferase [Silicimonas sp.]
MADIQIAPATPAHLPAILDQTRATFQEHRARNPKAFPDKTYRMLESRHRAALLGDAKGSITFAATAHDASLAGFVLLRSFTRAAMIYDIGTLPAARRSGVGSALLAHALTVAKDRRWEMLFASVWDGNEASHRLFQKAGFAASLPMLSPLKRFFPNQRLTAYSYKLG